MKLNLIFIILFLSIGCTTYKAKICEKHPSGYSKKIIKILKARLTPEELSHDLDGSKRFPSRKDYDKIKIIPTPVIEKISRKKGIFTYSDLTKNIQISKNHLSGIIVLGDRLFTITVTHHRPLFKKKYSNIYIFKHSCVKNQDCFEKINSIKLPIFTSPHPGFFYTFCDKIIIFPGTISIQKNGFEVNSDTLTVEEFLNLNNK